MQRVIGFLIILLSVCCTVYEGVIVPNLPDHIFGFGDAYQIAGGISGLVIGLALVAFGKCIAVLLR